MKHQQEVIEKIRRGETGLMWKTDGGGYTDAVCYKGPLAEQIGYPIKVAAITEENDSFIVWFHVKRKLGLDKWKYSINSFEACQAKIQELYHEYLMLQAKKLDEGEA